MTSDSFGGQWWNRAGRIIAQCDFAAGIAKRFPNSSQGGISHSTAVTDRLGGTISAVRSFFGLQYTLATILTHQEKNLHQRDFGRNIHPTTTSTGFSGVGLSVRDIAEPLRSFDRITPAELACSVMDERHCEVAGVRYEGRIDGYVLRDEVGRRRMRGCWPSARRAVVLPYSAPLVELIKTPAMPAGPSSESWGRSVGS